LGNRIALDAEVEIRGLESHDIQNVQTLLKYYVEALDQTYQYETTEQIRTLCDENAILGRFVKVVLDPTSAVLTLVEVVAEDVAE
jgi:hypothetical protein